MKRIFAVVVAALAVSAAHAAPPTVTPSPGYDARLQEQRAATSSFTTVYTPAPVPPAKPVTRHKKRSQPQ